MKPIFQSEEAPEDWDKAAVKVLVGTTHNAITQDPATAVFVKYSSPGAQSSFLNCVFTAMPASI